MEKDGDMILVFANRNGYQVSRATAEELVIFTRGAAETKIKGDKTSQKFYAPKDEFEFYQEWKENAVKTLLESGQKRVFIENIARRHKLRLPK